MEHDRGILYYVVDVPRGQCDEMLLPIERINSTTCSIIRTEDLSERERVITELLDVFETSSKL